MASRIIETLRPRLEVVALIQFTLRVMLVAKVNPAEVIIVLALLLARLTARLRLLDVALAIVQFLTTLAATPRLAVSCTT